MFNSRIWDEAYDALTDIIAAEYMRRSEVAGSLRNYDMSRYNRVISKTGNFIDYGTSLKHLSIYLHAYYGKKPVVLIDDYDHPVQAGYANGYSVEAIRFISCLLSFVMKDNSSNVEFGIITGTMWLEHLGGFNNYACYTIRNSQLAEHFGFTREEVRNLLEYYGLEDMMSGICVLFGGHRIGGVEIFRPLDILDYLGNFVTC
ncbi:MAG: AAA family ATPase [Clostridia bacterium]|nr:AAA family ATPase [Clostridia bacterium]